MRDLQNRAGLGMICRANYFWSRRYGAGGRGGLMD
jgi:hypothetical protein